jgi:hypothetical protein
MEFTITAAGLITPIRKVLLGVFLWRKEQATNLSLRADRERDEIRRLIDDLRAHLADMDNKGEGK